MIELVSNQIVERRTAVFSDCMVYRYSLEIIWDDSRKPQLFVGLNPSSATHEIDDPTVRRCKDFAKRWGAGGLVMTNACAYRATDPKVMLAFEGDQIGPQNNLDYLERIASGCRNKPIAAWGKHADKVNSSHRPHRGRGAFLAAIMGPLDCLRLNKDGSPCHPLYLPATLTPIPFNYKAVSK